MRIIAGKWRGWRIASPEGKGTRPILDRVKTVLFDMLGTRLAEPGRLPPIAVLDLFAGSGTLGLEALSRGASFCLFVERHRPTAALIRKNLDAMGIVDQGWVVESDAAVCDFIAPPTAGEGAAGYELVFVDPPYRLLTGPSPADTIRTLLQRLATEEVIAPSALIVVRQPQQADGGPDLSPLAELERRDVGKMTLRFMTPARGGDSAAGEEF